MLANIGKCLQYPRYSLDQHPVMMLGWVASRVHSRKTSVYYVETALWGVNPLSIPVK